MIWTAAKVSPSSYIHMNSCIVFQLAGSVLVLFLNTKLSWRLGSRHHLRIVSGNGILISCKLIDTQVVTWISIFLFLGFLQLLHIFSSSFTLNFHNYFSPFWFWTFSRSWYPNNYFHFDFDVLGFPIQSLDLSYVCRETRFKNAVLLDLSPKLPKAVQNLVLALSK